MKTRFIFFAGILLFTMHIFAQTDLHDNSVLDFEEDTTNVTSLDDIIKMQNLVYSKSFRSDVIKGIWKRKNHFSITYAQTTLSGENIDIYDATESKFKKMNYEYKSDWAANIKRSRTYAFHKNAIADMISFGLEFTSIDLSVNHFKKDSTAKYDSYITREEKNEDEQVASYHYLPWGSEMYTFSFGMNIGPSIIIAPFARLNSPGLAHIRIQGYFTVGYRGSLMLMSGDDKMDVRYPDRNKYPYSQSFERVSDSNKLSWSHGLTTAWGIRLNWKGIAVGFEMINAKHNLSPVETKIYGHPKYKFTESSMRLSLIYTW